MKKTITVQGTHCNACKVLIEDVCSEIPEITSCSVDFATGKVDIEYQESLDWDHLKEEIESLGEYKVVL